MPFEQKDFLAGSLQSNLDSIAALKALSIDGLRNVVAASAGDFAFGVTLAQGIAFLAVDRFAVKSACYCIRNGQLHFAERADQLADASTELDPQALFDYLYFHAIPSPRTVFKDVYRLPPGHCAVWQNGELTVAPYWVPNFQPAQGSVSFDALKTEFRGLMQDAVASRLDGGKAGCFLSGGTDSSTVAGMVREAAGRGAAS